MRYIDSAQGHPTSSPHRRPALMEAIMKLGAEATAAGALLDNAGLRPGAAGARVQLTGGHLSVIDGPFAEAKEFISYALVRGAVQGGGRASGRPASCSCTWSLWPGLGGRVERAQGLRAGGLRATGLSRFAHDPVRRPPSSRSGARQPSAATMLAVRHRSPSCPNCERRLVQAPGPASEASGCRAVARCCWIDAMTGDADTDDGGRAAGGRGGLADRVRPADRRAGPGHRGRRARRGTRAGRAGRPRSSSGRGPASRPTRPAG